MKKIFVTLALISALMFVNSCGCNRGAEAVAVDAVDSLVVDTVAVDSIAVDSLAVVAAADSVVAE